MILNYIIYILSIFFFFYCLFRTIVIATRSQEQEEKIQKEFSDIKISAHDYDQNRQQIKKIASNMDAHVWISVFNIFFQIAGLFTVLRAWFIVLLVMAYIPAVLKFTDGEFTLKRHQRIVAKIIDMAIYAAVVYKFHLMGY